jgi:hypothetical protein
MARTEANKISHAFVKGLITEASPLTFPENASLSEENFVLSRKGSRQRRLGFDLEENFVQNGEAVNAGEAYQCYEWLGANDDPNRNFLVVQLGVKLIMYDLSADTISGSSPKTILLENRTGLVKFGFTTITGRLIIATGNSDITVVEYDPVVNSFVTHHRSLFIRDIYGVDDGLGPSYFPTNLTALHKYNLRNQGWTDDRVAAFKAHPGSRFPPNSYVWHVGKKINPSTGDVSFDPGILNATDFGSTPAPKGRAILNAFKRGASRTGGGKAPVSPAPYKGKFNDGFEPDFYDTVPQETPSALPTDITNSGCLAIAQFAGRVFYSGAESSLEDGDSKSPNLGSYVFFSQVAETLDNINQCMQVSDPTSEHFSSIVDSDGGTIKVAGSGLIKALVPLSKGLAVFAENGVWQITGGDAGFRATEFAVIKVTDVGITNPSTIVVVDAVAYYWTQDGIFLIAPDERSGLLNVTNISQTTIQTLYNDISSAVKVNATGTYDKASNQVRWLFSDKANYNEETGRYRFNKELILDITLGAFSLNRLTDVDTGSGRVPYPVDYIQTPSTLTIKETSTVVVGSDFVVASGNSVVSTAVSFSDAPRSIKYFVITREHNDSALPFPAFSTDFSVGWYYKSSFKDWEYTGSGVDAPAFLITGYDTFQDSQRNKKISYITTHMTRTEKTFDTNGALSNPSGCLMQVQWEWSDSVNSGRWSREQQIYRLRRVFLGGAPGSLFDYGFSVISTRNKVRGKGKAISIRFASEPGKDCKLLGWSMNISGETRV